MTLPAWSRRLIKRAVMFAYCHGWIEVEVTTALFVKLKLADA